MHTVMLHLHIFRENVFQRLCVYWATEEQHLSKTMALVRKKPGAALYRCLSLQVSARVSEN